MTSPHLILLAHGSKKPSWRKPFEKMLRQLRAECGEERIHLAFMESSHPILPQMIGELAGKGILKVRILPLFMSSGNHLAHDIPDQIKALTRQYKGLKVKVLPHIGAHPLFLKMMFDLIRDQLTPGRRY